MKRYVQAPVDVFVLDAQPSTVSAIEHRVRRALLPEDPDSSLVSVAWFLDPMGTPGQRTWNPDEPVPGDALLVYCVAVTGQPAQPHPFQCPDPEHCHCPCRCPASHQVNYG